MTNAGHGIARNGIAARLADGHQIKQVLLNLIINAEQAMQSANGRGALAIRTWHDRDRESVIIEVNDDGPGLSEEKKDRIFDPFFTTKEVGEGTGLGLTVAYAIRNMVVASGCSRKERGRRSRRDSGQRRESRRGRRRLSRRSLDAFRDWCWSRWLALAAASGAGHAGFEVDRAADGAESDRLIGAS